MFCKIHLLVFMLNHYKQGNYQMSQYMFYIKIYMLYNGQNLENSHQHIFYIDHLNYNINTNFHIFNKWNINFLFKLNKTNLLL